VEVHRQRSLPNATCGICEKRADRSNLLGIALELYRVRRKFGVLFQDGALFGSMNIYDNVASRCASTKKRESEIRDIVDEKLNMVGLVGAEKKLPGEISGG